MVTHGGFAAAKVDDFKEKLHKSVNPAKEDSYTYYARGVFDKAISERQKKRHELWQHRRGSDRTECTKFFTYFSEFHREMTLDVMDYVELWPRRGFPMALS